jgi:hypothetical protein
MLWRGNSWDGQFEILGNITRSNGPGEKQWSWVDPTLWLDHRGNIHVVANMGYDGDGGKPIGSHAFSSDGGKSWHSFSTGSDPAEIHPIYNGTTTFVGSDVGTNTTNTTSRWLHFERPKIILDPSSGRPVALFCSVGSHDSSMAFDQPPQDRSWTIARPIRAPTDDSGSS